MFPRLSWLFKRKSLTIRNKTVTPRNRRQDLFLEQLEERCLLDAALPTVQFASLAFTANESAGTVPVAVVLNAPSIQTVTVNYTITGDTTATGGDPTTPASGLLMFGPGMTSQTIPVAIAPNGANNADEMFVLALSSPSNATLGAPTNATLTIHDDMSGTPIATQTLTFINPLALSASEGVPVTYQVQATSTGGSVLTYTATGLPWGLVINPSTGLISGTPASGSASSQPYQVSITAIDHVSSATENFSLTVHPPLQLRW
jgi:hypothetical protein